MQQLGLVENFRSSIWIFIYLTEAVVLGFIFIDVPYQCLRYKHAGLHGPSFPVNSLPGLNKLGLLTFVVTDLLQNVPH